jgi:hypothetical protein
LEPRRRELRHQPLDAVKRPDAGTITPAEAKLVQPGSEDLDLARELLPAPTQAVFAEHDREPVGIARPSLQATPQL